MTPKNPHPTQPPREKAFLVGVDLYKSERLLTVEDSLSELALLADTAGLDVVGELTQKLEHPNPETFIGAGKVEELKALVEETLANVVIFDDELSPRHLRELEKNSWGSRSGARPDRADSGHLCAACSHQRGDAPSRTGPI